MEKGRKMIEVEEIWKDIKGYVEGIVDISD